MTKVDPKVSSGTTTSHVSSGPSTPVAGGHYTVKPGDTLWDLAKAVYGDGSRWKEIADANPGLTSRGLNPGSQIKLPPKSQNDKLVGGDPGRNATRILDDGKPKSGGPAPQANPQLSADLQNARAHAAVAGGHGGTGNTSEANHGTEHEGEAWLRDKEPEKFLKSGASQTLATTSKTAWRKDVAGSGEFVKGKGWVADRKDVNDEAGGNKRAGLQTSANLTIASKYGKAEVAAWEAKGEAVIAGGNVAARGSVKVLNAKAEGSAAFGADLKNLTVKGDLSGHVEANLVTVEGSLKTKPYGNQYIGGQTEVKARAFVGAEATGNATVAFDPRKGTVMASAGVDAFAGAKATAEINQSFKVGGMNVGSVGARGEVYAGIGIKANAKVGLEKGHLKASFEVGAALGIGAGVKLNIDVNVAEPIKAVGNALGTAGKAVGGAVSDGAHAVADGAKKVWNKITSLW